MHAYDLSIFWNDREVPDDPGSQYTKLILDSVAPALPIRCACALKMCRFQALFLESGDGSWKRLRLLRSVYDEGRVCNLRSVWVDLLAVPAHARG